MRKWVIHALQLTLAVALLVVVWRLADGGQALRLLSEANLVWLLAAALVLTLQIVLSARRWQLTASQLGITLSAGTVLREYYLSQLVNQVLPGGVLGDAGRAVRARRQAGLVTSSYTVILERLAGQAGLFVLLATTFVITSFAPGGFDWPAWLAVPVVVLLVAVAAVPPAVILGAGKLPGRMGQMATELAGSARQALLAPAVRWRQLALSLATATANVTGFALCALAIGAPLSATAAIAIIPLILFTMLLPVTVSGWGLREGAAATLFPLAGLTAAEGLAASVAFGVVLLVIALPCIAFLRTPREVVAR